MQTSGSFFGASKKDVPWSCSHVNISLKNLGPSWDLNGFYYLEAPDGQEFPIQIKHSLGDTI